VGVPSVVAASHGSAAVFLQGIVGLCWILLLVFANQLVGPCPIASFFSLQVVYVALLILSLVWMVLGLGFLAGAEPCLDTAPTLYKFSLAQVILLLPFCGIGIFLVIEWCIRNRSFFSKDKAAANKAGEGDAEEEEAGAEGGDGEDSEEEGGTATAAARNAAQLVNDEQETESESDEEEPEDDAKE
jgi:hypothetical protein